MKSYNLKLSFLAFVVFISVYSPHSKQLCAHNPHQTHLDELPQEHPIFTSLNHHENRVFFIDRGRSGTHWLIYIMQYFSERPCLSGFAYSDFFNIKTNFFLPSILHSHNYKEFIFDNKYFCALNTDNDYLITIIRDPKECLTRGKDIQTIYKILQQPNLYEFLELYDTGLLTNQRASPT